MTGGMYEVISKKRDGGVLDGEEIARLEQYVWAPGICYLRVRLLSPWKDEHGVLIRSVRATVDPACDPA